MLRPNRNRRDKSERLGGMLNPNPASTNEADATATAGQKDQCGQTPTHGKRLWEGRPSLKQELPSAKEPQQGSVLDEFDEYGTELHRDARVWKVYVKETDKWDAELVKGSTDVILIFAALFSAISTAFLIESSKSLQEDPSETATQALLVISQTLRSIADGTQQVGIATRDLPPESSAQFEPSRTAVWVNTLWYLSLSLSLATSFIAILAKDWCHSFMTGRTGHPFSQTCRRQRKWDMIEQWKMSELLAVLPSLIHVALFLFSIGLCIHLWNTHIIVAIPVLCVSAVAFGFYICSSVAAILFDYFPYQTIISKFCRTQAMEHAIQFTFWAACQLPRLFGYAILWVARFLIGIPIMFFGIPASLWLQGYLPRWQTSIASSSVIVQLASWPLLVCVWIAVGPALLVFILLALAWNMMELIGKWIKVKFSKVKEGPAWLRWYSQLVLRRAESNSKRGNVMGLALSWLIKNCEVPQSVDIALQSISGAGKNLSRGPLEECDATLEILRRLASSNLYRGGNTTMVVSLYSRALSFLSSPTEKASNDTTPDIGGDLEVMIWDLQTQVEGNVATLITDGQFQPSSSNLSALRIGNTAASRSLQLLRDDSEDSTKLFNPIIGLLNKHLGKEDILHPSSLLSLLSAASLFSLCTDNTVVIPSLRTLCLQLFEDDGYTRSPLVRMTAIACALSQNRGPKEGLWLQRGVPSRIEGAVRTLIDIQSRSEEDLAMMTHLGLQELLGSLDGDEIWETESHSQRVKMQRDVGRFAFQMQPDEPKHRDNIQRYLQALHDMYLLKDVVAPTADNYVLILESVCRSPGSRRLCWKLLSKIRCPDLYQLAMYLGWRSVVPLLVRAIKGPDKPATALAFPRGLRLWNQTKTTDIQMEFFATAQLWLFFTLCLASSANEPSRVSLQAQLQVYSPDNVGEAEDHREQLREKMIQSWENSSDIIASELGVYAFRLLECAYQLHNLTVPQQVIDGLQNVPQELRGLSSFVIEWQSEPIKSPTDEEIPTHTFKRQPIDEASSLKLNGPCQGGEKSNGTEDALATEEQREIIEEYQVGAGYKPSTGEVNTAETREAETKLVGCKDDQGTLGIVDDGDRAALEAHPRDDTGTEAKYGTHDEDHISINMSNRNLQ